MRVLVDTSIWIDHLHASDSTLTALLLSEQVFTHPVIVGELSCGSLKNREKFLGLLGQLPSLKEENFQTVSTLVETKRWWGKRLGWSDVQLLASCTKGKVILWTRDRALLSVARQEKVSFLE